MLPITIFTFPMLHNTLDSMEVNNTHEFFNALTTPLTAPCPAWFQHFKGGYTLSNTPSHTIFTADKLLSAIAGGLAANTEKIMQASAMIAPSIQTTTSEL